MSGPAREDGTVCAPRATLRLQFHKGYTLDDARAQVGYFAALGISHVYASPLLGSVRGSTHGYDGVRPDRIDAELGGEAALRRLMDVLREHDMGLVMDLVPNHMSASLENPWWFDVLEHGQGSEYANYFDIDWDAGGGRVLLPWLTSTLDACLASGDVAMRFDQGSGRVFVHAGPARVPLGASHYPAVLQGDSVAASPLAQRFAGASDAASFNAARRALKEAAAQDPALRAEVDAALERWLANDEAGRLQLRGLLSAQPWQLADWHVAPRRINWRRFFDIGALAALRVEQAEVFDAVHELPLSLYAEGLIDGLRIDHVDGLLDPGGYCRRLRAELDARRSQRPPALQQPAWLVVEKILATDEPLRTDWQVDGSTGYDFMEQVGALLHDGAGEQALTGAWQAVAAVAEAEHADTARFQLGEGFASAARTARREILQKGFAADLTRALRALAPLADTAADDADLRTAVAALIEWFPVYRTYLEEGAADAHDRQVLERACGDALPQLSENQRLLLRTLVARLCGDALDPAQRALRVPALPALQQLTPPIAAKAIEDTTFYRYARLLSRNEVGAEPAMLALPVDAFHDLCAGRARQWPRAMLATATHDHKRGEDARARLAVLSADAQWWQQRLLGWQDQHEAQRVAAGNAPDAIDAAMLYQALVATWPPGLQASDSKGIKALADRVADWQRKALREAKRHSSWAAPDQVYEQACERFLRALLEDAAFVRELVAAVERVMAPGAVNALAQVLLRNTVPGVPDLYQGCEWWDHSLVDPDNRRPVDYQARAAVLDSTATPAALRADWQDGRIKQRVLARVLQLRQRDAALFECGDYLPLRVHGAAVGHVIAFLRSNGSRRLLVVAPLHASQHGCWRPDRTLALDAMQLERSSLELPLDVLDRPIDDVLSGTSFDLHEPRIALARVLHDWPIALWYCG